MLNSFPSLLKPSLPRFTALTLDALDKIDPVYQTHYITESGLTAPSPANGEEDSDVSSDLPGLIGAMLDFLSQACAKRGSKDIWSGGLLPVGMATAIKFGRMTTDDVSQVWSCS